MNFIEMLISWEHLDWLLKISLTAILGGTIGFERERLRRPAGLRTHILVAVGATLVTIANTEIIKDLGQVASIAPARYGAAVISGIGFLGAGTIVKSGVNVKGLTTAATIWTTACIGIVIGHGYYFMALFSTLIIFITLEAFIRIEDKVAFGNPTFEIDISISSHPGTIGRIGDVLQSMDASIVNMSIQSGEENNKNHVLIHVRHTKRYSSHEILDALRLVEGIEHIEENAI